MHLVGFIIRIYHDARSPGRQIKKCEELKLVPIYIYIYTRVCVCVCVNIDISGEGDLHPLI